MFCCRLVQKKKTTTSGMGAFGDIGGVLMGKQEDGKARTVSSPSINMTVMKVDEESGIVRLRISKMLFSFRSCLRFGIVSHFVSTA